MKLKKLKSYPEFAEQFEYFTDNINRGVARRGIWKIYKGWLGPSRGPISWRSAGRVRDLRAAIKRSLSISEAAIDGETMVSVEGRRSSTFRVHLPYVETWLKGEWTASEKLACRFDARSFSFFFFLPFIRCFVRCGLARVGYVFEHLSS